MSSDDVRLSQLSTQWSLIVRANLESGSSREALAELLPRYCSAVYRYLLRLVRNEDAVDDLCQEFALRFARGDFRNARPEKGRFRDYVKASVLHLAAEHHRRIQEGEKLLPFDSRVMTRVKSPSDIDTLFVETWRRELLNQTWQQLQLSMPSEPPTGYEILRLKSEQPELTSNQIAEALSRKYHILLTAANIRQILHRTRERFIDLLKAEVAISLPTTDPREVDTELAELGLLVYCRTMEREKQES